MRSYKEPGEGWIEPYWTTNGLYVSVCTPVCCAQHHKYYRGKSPYYLPKDEAEQERMNLVHEMSKLWLNGNLCAAPIGDLRHVLVWVPGLEYGP